jgi:hypothetical protein
MSGERTSDWADLQTPEPSSLYSFLNQSISKLDENKDKIPNTDWRLETALSNASRELESGEPENWKLELNPYLVFNLETTRDFPKGRGQLRLGSIIKVRDGEFRRFSTSFILAVRQPDSDDGLLSEGLDHCCVQTGEQEAKDGDEFFHVLERIHWDIDTGSAADESKPLCHVQMGGNIGGPAFESHENYHYCTNGLDKPRIPHPPMDPVLAFNMAIDQYESLESFNQRQWRGTVTEAETKLWNPYYKATHGMSNTSKTIINQMQPESKTQSF